MKKKKIAICYHRQKRINFRGLQKSRYKENLYKASKIFYNIKTDESRPFNTV